MISLRVARVVRITTLLTIVGLVGACARKEPPSTGDSASAAKTDTAGKVGCMAGMPGMAGMSGMGTAMMDSMQTHMGMMSNMTGDQLAAALPTHRQMVANMVSQMTTEMRSMNMAADAAWTATIDSVRQDLVRLPEMSKTQLKDAMPAHSGRVSRLIQMHKDMMAKMGK